jgi:hypothetical protein
VATSYYQQFLFALWPGDSPDPIRVLVAATSLFRVILSVRTVGGVTPRRVAVKELPMVRPRSGRAMHQQAGDGVDPDEARVSNSSSHLAEARCAANAAVVSVRSEGRSAISPSTDERDGVSPPRPDSTPEFPCVLTTIPR